MKLYNPSFVYELASPGPVVGLDEAGCGCWAGPVVAGCVFLKPTMDPGLLSQLHDSKILSKTKREEIFALLTNHPDVLYGVGEASVQEIDHLNIRKAAMLAMQRAYQILSFKAGMALVDGTTSPLLDCPTKMLIKGDQKSYSIAAASIIAKVTRDKVMENLAVEYPAYQWHKNAGYGTRDHQQGLKNAGISPHHRRSYKPIQLILDLEKKVEKMLAPEQLELYFKD